MRGNVRWYRLTFRGVRLLSPSVQRGIEECYLLATNV